MTQTRRRRRPRRRAILTLLAFAFAAAAVAGAYAAIFCFHYYTVASNSMSPTLMGNNDLRDRVLCWLRAFPGRAPRRWEIVIFHTPNRENLELLAEGGTFSLRHDMTIKRVVGLGGEEIALRDGDVWTRRGENAEFARRAKPEEIQKTLWIPVYEASFPDEKPEEFSRYWRAPAASGAAPVPGLSAGPEGLRVPAGAEFRFVPWMRTGMMGREMRALPGVPDRYLLPQRLTFRCAECGEQFIRWFAGGQVRERCPACGATAYEESVLVYSHDSGLTVVGEDAVAGIPAGDAARMRVYPYHIVSDLRLTMEAMLPYGESGLALRLEKNGVSDEVGLSAAGVVFNRRLLPARPDIEVGKWFTAEFSRADGELRLSVNGTAVELPPGRNAADESTIPEPGAASESSGVSFAATFAPVNVRRLSAGRDIHYFSGVGNPYMPQFSAFSGADTIAVPENSFLTLGDNADVSLDSRSWGGVPCALLAGTAVWWDAGERVPGADFGENAPERGRH